ncbi:TetR/AcrR family transcriptional regulator [Gandjariella thermophila]|uniref:TetR family transcriptional regulator n=1 Tax=Gandjariella thermophila TaxID=1931992 RepID=A0A4D4J6M0_9PSEU|nr:TetR/AcrR family transcriptional regulator [Gandjariella thermophila]GDY29583.1 TetR family transcriptional regulator [Gandjariella thermophila]
MPGVKSRREQYSEATRAALLETATTLFAERGFARTALEDVASATQVTRGAVYHHFASKRELFEAVLESLETEATRRIAEAAAGTDDAWDAAMIGLDAFLDQCCDPVYGRLCWQEGPVALGWDRWKECEEKYAYGLTSQFVTSLMDAGYIEQASPEITTRFVFALLGAIGSMLADAAEADKPRVREECATLARRLLTGLRPRPA